jgi:hypothetical protein
MERTNTHGVSFRYSLWLSPDFFTEIAVSVARAKPFPALKKFTSQKMFPNAGSPKSTGFPEIALR